MDFDNADRLTFAVDKVDVFFGLDCDYWGFTGALEVLFMILGIIRRHFKKI